MDESGIHLRSLNDMARRMNELGGGNPEMELIVTERIDMSERTAMERTDEMERRFDETMQSRLTSQSSARRLRRSGPVLSIANYRQAVSPCF